MAPSLAPNTGCAAELPANVFTGDSRWHLVTGAFGGLGRLAVNWLRERGATHRPAGAARG
ncbi:KR domain-containing protein [Salmonella enterica subsp. enterica serovar Senftenberg]|nr:KR domain-containing protein [Salmonella enterica subsp. enterica serovar Senftenberg]